MTLVVAASPIGQIDDASPRLAAALATADVIAAEDTRRLRRLLAGLGVTTAARVVSYFDGNEEQRTPGLLAEVAAGRHVVLVTDAGMPSVSDPGYRLVAAAVDQKLPVTVVPGPSAVLAALAISGLPVDRFCFEGFLPRRPAERARRLADLEQERRTLVFFEAPHRTTAALRAMADAFGAERQAALCRELTKTHEEVRRGPLEQLVADSVGIRGEVTIVVSGATQRPARQVDDADLRRQVNDLVGHGMSRKDAVTMVARSSDLARKVVYNAAHRN